MTPRRAGARRAGIVIVTCLWAQAACAGPDAADARRLRRIEAALAREASPAATWQRSWALTFGALIVVQGGAALLSDDAGLRIDATVGTVKTSLGLLSTVLRPWSPVHAARDLAELPEGTAAERRLKLARAAELLEQGAKDEELGTSWLARVGAVTVNLAGTYYLWIAHERYSSGWLALGSGLVVSELQLRTQPTALASAPERFELTGACAPGRCWIGLGRSF